MRKMDSERKSGKSLTLARLHDDDDDNVSKEIFFSLGPIEYE